MNMEFTTSDSIDLDGFSENQSVSFRLVELSDGSYLVAELKSMDEPSATHQPAVKGHPDH